MAIGARRYVLASLGGLAVVSASVSGLQLLQTSRPQGAGASISGMLPRGCTVRGTLASCRQAPTATVTPASGNPSAAIYRDGVYDVTGHYLTPGGAETIGVDVTLLHGAVTASSVQVEAVSPTARQFQVQFASRYASRVNARQIAGMNLTRVAGASLTSVGFDDAIARVKAAARV